MKKYPKHQKSPYEKTTRNNKRRKIFKVTRRNRREKDKKEDRNYSKEDRMRSRKSRRLKEDWKRYEKERQDSIDFFPDVFKEKQPAKLEPREESKYFQEFESDGEESDKEESDHEMKKENKGNIVDEKGYLGKFLRVMHIDNMTFNDGTIIILIEVLNFEELVISKIVC